ncbi:transglycosylase SLT domain-containing protein [Azonexus sp.]|uniref:transglycosylase SLT domain-containing protein n=1 Tax=Azonexus sp. TaxID=1872668 RepID=UPI0035ADE986
MQQRNVLSLLRRLAGAGLAALACNAPALAEPADKFPLLALMMAPTAAAQPTRRIAEDTLTLQEIEAVPQLPGTIDLTAPTDNLWERIRNGFAMTNLNDDLVLYYQQWYQARPDALRRMVERSRPYLHHIVEELEARGMPTELALLPMVESSFNPMAYSRSHAAGLWQFIPATGKRFNLEQNWWQDQRRDIVASTAAALDYLQTIYDMHGDWHLALASYNWGEGAVKRAIEKNESRGLPTDYPNLTMPNETRHYVPKLQALKNIFGNPALVSQLDLPRIPNRPYFAMLEAPRTIDIKTAARLANMSVDEFQRLNPSHNRPIIKAESAVVIPADKMETFHHNLQNHQAPLSEWQAHTLKSSERLNNIAGQFGISAGELARANGLPENARLRAGSTLLVPGSGSSGNLAPLLNASAPQYVIESEPVARTCIKSKRGGRLCVATPPRPERAAAKPALAEQRTGGKAASRIAAKPAAVKTVSVALAKPAAGKSGKVAAAKPAAKAAPAKIARNSPHRRG